MTLAEMISNGTISVDELANAPELIERARLVTSGLKACHETLLFPLGVEEIQCYCYTDFAGEYHSWGIVNRDGVLVLYSNWGGEHEIGRVNLNDSSDVFFALEKKDLRYDLTRFLEAQIDKTGGHRK